VPNINGTGWIVTELPYMNSVTVGVATTLVVVSNGVNARDFDVNGSTFTEHSFLQDKLTHSGTQYTLTDTTGDQMVFWDFSTSNLANQRGQLQSFTDPDGNTVNVTSRDGTGRPTEVQRTVTIGSTTTTESLLYSYNASNLISNVTLRRSTNGGMNWTIIRQVAYTYYATGEAHGNFGDLKLAQIEDGSGNILDTKYYRYYAGESGGYTDALKYVFNAQSYARLVAALGTNLSNLTDMQVSPYANNYFTYDSSQRVTEEIVQGLGCSSCGGGLGTFTFAYSTSTNSSGYNSWANKNVETLPDGNQNIVYTNFAGEVMLSVYYDIAGIIAIAILPHPCAKKN
jgi:YD repeat-containing protein